MSRRKVSVENKIYAVNLYLDGKESQRRIADMFDVSLASVQQWIRNYHQPSFPFENGLKSINNSFNPLVSLNSLNKYSRSSSCLIDVVASTNERIGELNTFLMFSLRMTTLELSSDGTNR